jgi:hypothetical protein
MTDPLPPDGPVLRLVRRIADHADAIYVRVSHDDRWVAVAYTDLAPDDQADYLVQWLDKALDGWDGPFRVVRDQGA